MGNIRQVDRPQTKVIGYFSASAVSLIHYWLDRKDTQGVLAYGATAPVDTLRPKGSYGPGADQLFYALNGRQPNPEPAPPYLGERQKAKVRLWPNADRPRWLPACKAITKLRLNQKGGGIMDNE
ncbi:hypothetical protein [Spirosoma telluris]|uniref:hypothetical protein n=1 Tax=Spirosoma telluris TaxID=2183553 RepID=UPI002FC3BAA9